VPAVEHDLGPVMQNGFVVDDVPAAIEHWARILHVGPFFVFERVPFKEVWYRGQPAGDIDLTVAIAYSGDLQIELVHQRNDVPSIYTDFRARHGTGLQHMGVLSENLERDLARLRAKNVLPVQYGTLPECALRMYPPTITPGAWWSSSRRPRRRSPSLSACARRLATGTVVRPL